MYNNILKKKLLSSNYHEKKKEFYRKKYISRESIRETKIHGKFFLGAIYLNCRISVYFLRVHRLTGFGKGSLSRSEPLFCHPNPSFNSIGRAARESSISRISSDFPWNFEFLKINLTESFFLFENKILKIKGKFKKKKLKIILKKLNPLFFLNYKIFERYRKTLAFLKSGIKYGGQSIIYFGNLYFSNHNHSKCVLLIENMDVKEYSCQRCSLRSNADWNIFQSKIRLAQQVSKKINILTILKNKKNGKILYKNSIVSDIILERLALK